jgi:hypothetical protein
MTRRTETASVLTHPELLRISSGYFTRIQLEPTRQIKTHAAQSNYIHTDENILTNYLLSIDSKKWSRCADHLNKMENFHVQKKKICP